MEQWTDQGLVLSVRPHGEGAAVLNLFTAQHGLHAGYVYGAFGTKNRALLENGNLLHVEWTAKSDGNLGVYKLESLQQYAVLIMSERSKLFALQALCALLDASLPEREAHAELFQTTCAVLTVIAHSDNDIAAWGEAYIKWEIALLRQLGFSLDLTRCAGGGDARQLAYISPKSGCAVSYKEGEPYKDKLLPLPDFLKPNGGMCDEEEFRKGLQMTGAFLEKWVFAQHTKGVPDARLRFAEIFGVPDHKSM